MHVSSVKDPVEIRGRNIVLSVGGFFLYRKLIHAEGNISFRIVRLLLSLVSSVRGEFTQVAALDPGETAQGNRRLGGQRRRFVRIL